MSPISILVFLKEFRNAYESVVIHEGVARWLVSYFMKMSALSSLETRLSPRKIRASGLHDEKLSTYVEVVTHFLGTYATNNIIAQTMKELEFYKQTPGVSAALYAMNLYTNALRCRIVCVKKRVTSLFAEGLNELKCNNIRNYLRKHPRASLKYSARYADTLIKIADRSFKTRESSKYNPTQPTVRPSRAYAHAVMTIDNDRQKSTLKAAPKSWNRSDDDKHQSGSPPSGDKISYCCVCLAKTHSILQGPFVSKPSDLIQMREVSFRRCDGTYRAVQTQLS